MEIELKIPLKPDLVINNIIPNISEKFGSPSEEITQIDTYFTSPIRDFWKSDEALRIRQIQTEAEKEKIELTYKGPKQGRRMKIREEINIEVSNCVNAKKIFQNLGFKLFGTIKKKRTNWYKKDFVISFDIVEDLGKFLEIEISTTSEHSEVITKSKERIINLAKEVIPNWSGEDERRSYLELMIEKLLNKQGN